jgi:hypothetical protein
MKTKLVSKMPVRSETRLATASLSIGRRGELGPEWDFSLWFALFSPLIGAALGLLAVFLVYR